ncbi:MAG: putative metalloprotease CJM1_0395 family protein [Planctomycetota bacterium]
MLDLSVEAVAANQAALSDPDTESDTGTPKTAGTKAASGEDLSPEEIEQVEWLSARDREVRTHEQAHLAAAGPYARGGPTYTFQTGPDGRQYAIGGEVEIDTSPVKGDPEATAAKARVVRAAALAPAEPSGQDRKVAAQATQMEQQALAEVRERESEPEAASETGQFLDLFA